MIDMDWMARYDIPAVIDFALAKAQHGTLTYVGTQGWDDGVRRLQQMEQGYARRLTCSLDSPLRATSVTRPAFARLLADLDVATIFQIFGQTTFLSNDWLVRQLGKYCADLGELCPDFLDIMCGDGNPANVNQSQIGTITL